MRFNGKHSGLAAPVRLTYLCDLILRWILRRRSAGDARLVSPDPAACLHVAESISRHLNWCVSDFHQNKYKLLLINRGGSLMLENTCDCYQVPLFAQVVAVPRPVYSQLDQVSQAINVSRLRYALPVWSGFLTADLINRIQALLKRLFKFGYSSHLISFSDLIKSCSEDLFESAHKSNHCLHELFSSYVHRLDLMLPACTGYLHKQSFIIKSLFEFFI